MLNCTDGRTTTAYSSKVTFENPQVLANSNTFQLQLLVPYVWDAQSTIQPKYPIVNVLFPVSGIEEYASTVEPACSTFTTDNYADPGQFSTNAAPADVNTYLQTWIAENSNLTFDTSTLGQILTKSLGNPSIGPDSIVKSVSYANNQFNYTIQFDLTAVVAGCETRGASVVTNSDGAVYQIPISYIEHTTNELYTQTTVYYEIAILLTGKSRIFQVNPYTDKSYYLYWFITTLIGFFALFVLFIMCNKCRSSNNCIYSNIQRTCISIRSYLSNKWLRSQ